MFKRKVKYYGGYCCAIGPDGLTRCVALAFTAQTKELAEEIALQKGREIFPPRLGEDGRYVGVHGHRQHKIGIIEYENDQPGFLFRMLVCVDFCLDWFCYNVMAIPIGNICWWTAMGYRRLSGLWRNRR